MSGRLIEVFSAGCPVCEKLVALIRERACPSCEVRILGMREQVVAETAERLGVRSLPAVTIDGKLADCCSGGGPEPLTLERRGLGQGK